MAKDPNTNHTGKRPGNAPERAEIGTPTPGPVIGTECAKLSPLKLRLFLNAADKVTDPETLADLLEGWTRQEAGRVETRLIDGGRFVNTTNPARLLEALRATLNDGKDPRNGKRWADSFPAVVARLNDTARIDGPTIYARVLARISPVEAPTEAGRVQPLYHLETALNRDQLARVFARLVEAGIVDGTAPESLADFLNAFAPDASKQGRINWIWTDKRTKRVSPRHILDFVAQLDGRPTLDTITPELCNKIAPAVFGRTIGRDIKTRFRDGWNAGQYCETHAAISSILSGV